MSETQVDATFDSTSGLPTQIDSSTGNYVEIGIHNCECMDIYSNQTYPTTVEYQDAYDYSINKSIGGANVGDKMTIGTNTYTYAIAPVTQGFNSYLTSNTVKKTANYNHSYLTDDAFKYYLVFLQVNEGLGPNVKYYKDSGGNNIQITDVYGIKEPKFTAYSYSDYLGNKTIGYGHYLGSATTVNIQGTNHNVSSGLSNALVDDLLNQDMVSKIIATHDFLGYTRWTWLVGYQPDWACICVDKNYNGGNSGLRGWPKMLHAMGLTGKKIYTLDELAKIGTLEKIPFVNPWKVFNNYSYQKSLIAQNCILPPYNTYKKRNDSTINLFIYQNDNLGSASTHYSYFYSKVKIVWPY